MGGIKFYYLTKVFGFFSTIQNVHNVFLIQEFSVLLIVWTLSLIVWTFLEFSVWGAHYFNNKHTTAVTTVNTVLVSSFLAKTYFLREKTTTLKIIYNTVLMKNSLVVKLQSSKLLS